MLSLWLRTFLYYRRRCRGRYDVVVTEGFGGSRIPRLTPLYVREPIITEWRQVHRELFAAQYPRGLLPLLNLLERVTAQIHRKTKVLAYTPEGKQAFVQIGFRAENVFVVPVSLREEWLAQEPGPRGKSPTIMWLGKFRRYKCPDHIVQAMPGIIDKVPNARLVLAGRHDDASYETELRALVGRLSLTKHVEFHFDLTEEEKRALLRSSRVLALPSSVEGFGIVVLEANACGVPVVASSGVPESVVLAERNGLRYPFGDLEALAASVLRLLTDDSLFQKLSDGGLNFAKSFSWQAIGSQYDTAVRAVAAGRTPESTLPTTSVLSSKEVIVSGSNLPTGDARLP